MHSISGQQDTEQATGPQLQLRRTYQASPEELFAAWTTPEALKRWHAPNDLTVVLAEVDLREGGRYRIHMQEPGDGAMHKVGGTYRVVDPPRKLVYTWRWEGEPVETEVTLEFLPKERGTELVLTHRGFVNDDARGHHEQGWTAIMTRLAGEY
jgi:uncharacterized protein YndB with AHSA1/START domain